MSNRTDNPRVELPTCHVCGNQHTVALCTVDGYDVWRCPICACDFVSPVPTEEQLKTLYDREEWFEGGERGGYLTYDGQTDASPPWLQRLLDSVADGADGTPSILDIGCAYGTHLAVARQQGWQCFGVEPSDHARNIAAARHPEIYFTDKVANLPPHRFNLILMLEVIEHIADPYKLFYELFSRDHIGPETVIVMTTPNARSYSATSDAAQWEFRHPPSHLLFYSAKTFETLLRRLRFSNIDLAGQHKLAGSWSEAGYGDEDWDVNARIADQAGLLITASGSDFAAFMQERFVPGTWSELTTYEHLPRYRYARSLAKGRRVLDFGSGTGYGSAMLAEAAESVTAVDIDEGALSYSRERHRNPRLQFQHEDTLARSLPDASFDLIVCFEVIEHLSVDDQYVLIEQFSRLITADGLVVISTPNPDVTRRYGDNPYHLHEMTFHEFTSRLSERFATVKPQYQRINAGISISSAAAEDGPHDVVPLQDATNDDPVAFLAICSHTPFEEPRNVIYRDHERDFIADRTTALRRDNLQLIELYEERTKAQAYAVAASNSAALASQAASSTSLLAQFESERERLEAEVASHAQALEAERAEIVGLKQQLADAQLAVSDLDVRFSAVSEERSALAEHLATLDKAYIAGQLAAQRSRLQYDDLSTRFSLLENKSRDDEVRQAQLQTEYAELSVSYKAALNDVDSTRWELSVLQAELHRVYSSTSWRLISRTFPYLRPIAPVAKPPLRFLAKIYRGLKRRSLPVHEAQPFAGYAAPEHTPPLSDTHSPSTSVSDLTLSPAAGEREALASVVAGATVASNFPEALLAHMETDARASELACVLDLDFETSLEPSWSPELEAYELRSRHHLRDEPSNNGYIKPYVLRPKYQTMVTNRPKILHVIPNVYVGGSTQLLIDIVEHLGDRYDHVVLTSALWPGGEHEGITVHRRRWDELGSVPELLMEIDPDLVHVHYWGLTDDPWYDAILGALEILPHAKVLENINTPIAPKLHPRIDHLVYVSEYVRREFHPPIARPEASSIVHPGIDLSAFDAPFSGDDAENAIGMVYRLEGDKLRVDAIDLFIRVAQLRPRTRIYIVGGGTFLEAYISKAYDANVRNNFCFSGYRPYSELPQWYDKFCIFVAPVWKESFGQVSAFGMAKHQAVAGYDIGALEEIIGTKDHLADDLDTLAHKIVDLLDDPQRRRDIGAYNSNRAKELFDVHAMVSEYRRIYDGLLAS